MSPPRCDRKKTVDWLKAWGNMLRVRDRGMYALGWRMKETGYYAHSLEDTPDPAMWQGLEQHLEAVARTAEQFAAPFHSQEWGYLAGLWHDLGKYQSEFQARLRGDRISAEHSGAGARLAVEKDQERGTPLAFVIAGHHAGLANLVSAEPGHPNPLQGRLEGNEEILRRMISSVPQEIVRPALPQPPEFLQDGVGAEKGSRAALRRKYEFWIRFLFSALVDADWLDTESFLDRARANLRGGHSPIPVLRRRLDSFIDVKIANLPPETRKRPVNQVRGEVLASCRQSAEQPPGLFALTVPTGGGKTLSAMSFALRHAERNRLHRVIVVIPYTSIIEQNAQTYREALGAEDVVEHHSNLDASAANASRGIEATERHHLACENWEAPVIVTTSVQFFESLFANRPSRCRKIHNVCRSVIVLDEVQTVPPQFLLTILDALNELVDHYGCSVVLATATPPALAARPRFEAGLQNVRQIISAPKELAARVKRVHYSWPLEGVVTGWPQLAEELTAYSQVLAVVHKRRDARALVRELEKALRGQHVFHLSALMCPAHRSDVLRVIKGILAKGEPCRVVSTQLVEAGVDVDFPVVYRALGGLDSVVQAAGRCNREGAKEMGRVVVFRAPTAPPGGTPAKGLDVTASLLREAEGALDTDDPALFEKYFRMLYLVENMDARGVQAERQQFNFSTVAERFQLIEDRFTQAVVVPYGDAEDRLERLRREGIERNRLRKLQPFVVNIYPDAFRRLMEAGALHEACPGIYGISPFFRRLYDQTLGLLADEDPEPDPEALVI